MNFENTWGRFHLHLLLFSFVDSFQGRHRAARTSKPGKAPIMAARHPCCRLLLFFKIEVRPWPCRPYRVRRRCILLHRHQPVSWSLQPVRRKRCHFSCCTTNYFLPHLYMVVLPDINDIWKEPNFLKSTSGIWTWYSKMAVILWDWRGNLKYVDETPHIVKYSKLWHLTAFLEQYKDFRLSVVFQKVSMAIHKR